MSGPAPSRASHATADSRHTSPLLLQTPSPSPSPSPTRTNKLSPNPEDSTTTVTQSQSDTPPPMNDDDDEPTATLPSPATAPRLSRPPPLMPIREDCWSEDATHTLIEAWGERYVELNRGNLRQKHWQDVADAVNARHGHVKKARRTDIQCKNRIDTLKKKYKIEKGKLLESNGNYTSQWPFFPALESLIGSSYKPSPSSAPHRRTPQLPALPPPSSVPVGPRSKRPAITPAPAPVPVDDSFFRRNFSAIAAAAAAAAEAEEQSETSRSRSSEGSRRRGGDEKEWCRELAEAMERFGEIYERVEEAKQRQMVELEKQRMEFAKDLEIQKMKLFMDSQIQLEKIKRAKRTSEADSYS
ncbi:trihelix transcription factor ASIL2-like [Cornus florida]|uniref:trihelix transcription factor ASIL2-like n=1 Tax=Cornus florida TaxID=4283 RepID=UPI00289891DB|nr:trihelix transcription factor ASIL2-like [Cornus florida]